MNTNTEKNASKIHFTSDTHFGHGNIIKYSNRVLPKGYPFGKDKISKKQIVIHDEMLIENWNKQVLPGDVVYHLGDFCWGHPSDVIRYRERLNGKIFLIRGNHDKPIRGYPAESQFAWIKSLWEFSFNKKKTVLCHYAMRVWNAKFHGRWHLYGHSHNTLPELPGDLSFDVGVDAIAARLAKKYGTEIRSEYYRPISYREVHNILTKKEKENAISIR